MTPAPGWKVINPDFVPPMALAAKPIAGTVINPDPVSVLDHALRYAGMSWAVLPLNWIDNGKCSCGTCQAV